MKSWQNYTRWRDFYILQDSLKIKIRFKLKIFNIFLRIVLSWILCNPTIKRSNVTPPHIIEFPSSRIWQGVARGCVPLAKVSLRTIEYYYTSERTRESTCKSNLIDQISYRTTHTLLLSLSSGPRENAAAFSALRKNRQSAVVHTCRYILSTSFAG